MKLIEYAVSQYRLLNQKYYRNSLLMGFSSGVPLLMTFGCLAMRLRMESGIEYKEIGYLALCSTPYSLKFFIAIFLNKMMKMGFFPKYNHYKGWMVLSQILVIIGLLFLSFIDVGANLQLLFLLVCLINTSAACQSCLTSVHAIHYKTPENDKSLAVAMQSTGLRIGMLVSGAGTLFLSQLLDSWKIAYFLVTCTLIAGLIGAMSLDVNKKNKGISGVKVYKNAASYLMGVLHSINNGRNILACLLIVLTYKIGDGVIGPLKNIFYLDMGFSRYQIAFGSKIFGVIAAILGAAMGHWIVKAMQFKKSLIFCMMIHGISVVFYLILQTYNHVFLFYLISIIDSLTAGLRGYMLFSLQIKLCGKDHYLEQMSILVSLEHLSRNVFGFISGFLVSIVGWQGLFILSILSYAIPISIITMADLSSDEDEENKQLASS